MTLEALGKLVNVGKPFNLAFHSRGFLRPIHYFVNIPFINIPHGNIESDFRESKGHHGAHTPGSDNANALEFLCGTGRRHDFLLDRWVMTWSISLEYTKSG
jgi:hypothetical protein